MTHPVGNPGPPAAVDPAVRIAELEAQVSELTNSRNLWRRVAVTFIPTLTLGALSIFIQQLNAYQRSDGPQPLEAPTPPGAHDAPLANPTARDTLIRASAGSHMGSVTVEQSKAAVAPSGSPVPARGAAGNTPLQTAAGTVRI